MEVSNYKCDICGKVEINPEGYGIPKGWIDVSIIGEEDDYWHRSKDICPECSKLVVTELLSLHGQEKT